MPSCKDVARAVASEGLADTDLPRPSVVRLHLLACRHCRRYAAQLRRIAEAARSGKGNRLANIVALNRLEAAILKRCLTESFNRNNRTATT